MRPSVDFSKSFQFGVNFTKGAYVLLGFNILSKKSWMNWRSFLSIFFIVYLNLSVVYTLCSFDGNLVMFLKSLSAVPDTIQSSFKMYAALKYGKAIKSVFDFLHRVYDVNSEPNFERARAQIRCGQYYRSYLRVGSVLLLCTLVMASISPLHGALILKERELIFETLIPQFTSNDDINYGITLFMQFGIIFVGFVASNAIDLIAVTAAIHFSLLAGLFLTTLKELDEIVQNDQINKNNKIIKEWLNHCAIMQIDIVEYVSFLNTTLASLFFCQIGTASASLVINCFCLVKTDWIGAYAYGLFAFIKIIVLCTIGTFVDVWNDQVATGVYETSWHLLPVDCQKIFYLLLLRSQRPAKLTIAYVQAPLNVATGAKIMKAIYSYLMLLLSFEE